MRRSRLAFVVLVLVLLAATPAIAQGVNGATTPRHASFSAVFRSLLPEFLRRIWGFEGPLSDPYGGAGVSAAQPQNQLTVLSAGDGKFMDPYGGTAPQATTPVSTSLH